MASSEVPAVSERSMTTTIKVGSWNLGWQESMLAGKNRERHFRKLHDVANLWGKHDLDAVMICELGEHDIGLSVTDQGDWKPNS